MTINFHFPTFTCNHLKDQFSQRPIGKLKMLPQSYILHNMCKKPILNLRTLSDCRINPQSISKHPQKIQKDRIGLKNLVNWRIVLKESE